MSHLPVKTLRVKRGIDQVPVDSLVIEDRSRSKRRLTDHGVVFRRVQPDEDVSLAISKIERNQVSQSIASAQLTPTVPFVRATQPGEENLPLNVQRSRSALVRVGPNAARPATVPSPPHHPSPSSAGLQTQSSSSTPRRYHLSRHPSSTSQVTLGSGGNKRKRDQPGPVFVETRTPLEDPTQPLGTINGQYNTVSNDVVHEVSSLVPQKPLSSPRKRPGASAAEKEWRAKNWAPSVPERKEVIRSAKQPSDKLVSDLEKFAQEVEYEDVTVATATKRHFNSKYQPKAPSLRYKDRHLGKSPTRNDDAMDLDVDEEEEDKYVYDIYVRDVSMKDPLAEGGAEPKGTFGFLVITDEDEPFWETYREDDDSEKEWDTDDEDENAENYYGADYPEDEVASDDELDLDAYKYYQGASNEEEYDADHGAWSDDEETRYPWKRNTDSHQRV